MPIQGRINVGIEFWVCMSVRERVWYWGLPCANVHNQSMNRFYKLTTDPSANSAYWQSGRDIYCHCIALHCSSVYTTVLSIWKWRMEVMVWMVWIAICTFNSICWLNLTTGHGTMDGWKLNFECLDVLCCRCRMSNADTHSESDWFQWIFPSVTEVMFFTGCALGTSWAIFGISMCSDSKS